MSLWQSYNRACVVSIRTGQLRSYLIRLLDVCEVQLMRLQRVSGVPFPTTSAELQASKLLDLQAGTPC